MAGISLCQGGGHDDMTSTELTALIVVVLGLGFLAYILRKRLSDLTIEFKNWMRLHISAESEHSRQPGETPEPAGTQISRSRVVDADISGPTEPNLRVRRSRLKRFRYTIGASSDAPTRPAELEE